MTTSTRKRSMPRQRQPELEHDHTPPGLAGLRGTEETGLVRCLAHGFPTPLARWHFHDEYELHLITATSGKAFVGDWIGPFHPGHLVLCGPRLPHNWVSIDLPEGGAAERDLVIQFSHEPIARAAEMIPELAEVLPLLERARHGIEFFGMSEQAQAHWLTSRTRAACAASRPVLRLSGRPGTLHRLPAAVERAGMQGDDNDARLEQINAIVDRITGDMAEQRSSPATWRPSWA
jgi:hypothetical protein